ncbi:MAG: glycosyltransferase [Candidatus Marsarchaeota archaeon]|nr:glycosyltransferase [Candidatus Marsarchaeota archaeon]MCL5102117.1 glycosyltransferase [Candidatus Marsarchaeota archaeon]
MKVLIAQANLTLKGGAEKVVLKVAQHYKSKVITAEYDPEATFPEFGKLDVEVIGGNGTGFPAYGRVFQGLKYGLGFYNMNVDEDYDVINAHIAPSHWIRNKNERVLWYCHTPLRDAYDMYRFRMKMKKFYQKPIHFVGIKAIRYIDKRVVSNIERIVANSQNTKERIEQYLGRKDARVIGGGIDYENYRNRGDSHYFIYPSRISPNKNQEFAIRAFNEFSKHKKGYKLLIVGAVSKDKFYSDYYERIVRLAKGNKDILIKTDVSEKELADAYSRSTAVLYPPINEDYGLVPLEGMASGKAVIALNQGGPRETLIDGKTGFLVNNENEMAKAMLKIANDGELAEKMGISGRERVVSHYSWEHFFREFDKELRAVAKG